MVVSGLGYITDTVLVALDPAATISFGEFTPVGEVILLMWLIGWGGRSENRKAETVGRAPVGSIR